MKHTITIPRSSTSTTSTEKLVQHKKTDTTWQNWCPRAYQNPNHHRIPLDPEKEEEEASVLDLQEEHHVLDQDPSASYVVGVTTVILISGEMWE